MTPLIILSVAFVLIFAVNKFFLKNRLSLSFIGRAALAMMLTVTGIAHFTSTDLMIEMMPDFLPCKRETVYLTGILELSAAISLLINKTAKLGCCSADHLFYIYSSPLTSSQSQASKSRRYGKRRDISDFSHTPADLLYRVDLLLWHKNK